VFVVSTRRQNQAPPRGLEAVDHVISA
jgi:hypothetical protein